MHQIKSTLLVGLIIICSLALGYSLITKSQGLYLPKDATDNQQLRLFLATGSAGGTYYALGNSIAQLWNTELDNKVEIITQSSGASVENIKRIESGEAQLIMAMNDTADDAWKGRGEFHNKMTHFRSIGVIYPEVLQGVVLQDSNIDGFHDILGKNIAIGPNGSGSAAFIKEIIHLENLSKQNLNLFHIVIEDGISSMKQGRMDGLLGFFAVPSGGINDLAEERQIKLLSFSEELIKKIKEKHPLISRFTIPAGVYGNHQPVNTISLKAVLFCKNDLPNELVYDLTKTLYEHRNELAGYHVAGHYLELATALEGVTVPLHPGAAKYYKEKGLKIPYELDSVDFSYQ